MWYHAISNPKFENKRKNIKYKIFNSDIGTIIWRNTCKYYGQFYNNSQNQERIRERTIWFLIVEKYNLYFKQSKYDFDTEYLP